jgi:Glyoxalase/Bleomycin resistance protein/Dioxygenase superfamily
MVHKLGHYGYVTTDFDSDFDFYTSNFNFVPSDVLYAPDNPELDVMTFIHLDLGGEYSDHHSLFLARAPPAADHTYLHHTSYEVEDFDTQLLGHEWLAKQGYESVWGVGRHILGSQIFDYWKDVSGFKIEHYADGDVVNDQIPTRRDASGPLSIWGPELPKTFHIDETKLPV